MRQRLLIDWSLSSYFGWGVYGLNLALAWASDPDIAFSTIAPFHQSELAVDPLRMSMLRPVLSDSAAFAEFRQNQSVPFGFGIPLLINLSTDLGLNWQHSETRVTGSPTIGVVFFEQTNLLPEAVAHGKTLPLIVTGSTWNEQVLREYGLSNVTTVLQGVDPTLFHPAPKLGGMGHRFTVFSGGKLEHRKGQDIVLQAFARFARSHPEALLVTAWHSPWPQFARNIDESGRAAPVVYDADGQIDCRAWAQLNGIPDNQFLDLGAVPNAFMPPILREMDVALFTNRAEGGTNLVAMECMACGVPTILSANTGHLDLIDEDSCFPLLRQGRVPGHGEAVGRVAGWGESDADEVVEALERAYADREEAKRRGANAARKLAGLTWGRTAAALKEIAFSFDASRAQAA